MQSLHMQVESLQPRAGNAADTCTTHTATWQAVHIAKLQQYLGLQMKYFDVCTVNTAVSC